MICAKHSNIGYGFFANSFRMFRAMNFVAVAGFRAVSEISR